jgi:hypothetical protein
MKTKDFASDAEVAALVDAFENTTIPASELNRLCSGLHARAAGGNLLALRAGAV